MSESISIDAITAGMVLANDVFDSSGNVLLGKGTELTERHQGILTKRGIEKVQIESAAEDEAEAAPALLPEDADVSEHAQQVVAHLEKVFSKVRGNETMEKLLSLAVARADHIPLQVTE